MKILAGSFIALWMTTVPMKLACLYRLISLRIARRYPCFAVWLLVGAVQTVIRIHAGFVGGAAGYEQTWIAGQWLKNLLAAGLVAECFWLYSKHFGSFRIPGAITAAAITLVALLSALSLADVGVPFSPDAPLLVLFSRHVNTTAFMITAATTVSFKAFGADWIRENVKRHAIVLQWYFFLQAVAYFVRYGTPKGTYYEVVAAFIGTGGGAFCYWMWYRAFTPQGELCDPAPGDRLDDLRAQENKDISRWNAGR